jgi:SAM-dependent methyltransferase
MIANCKICNRPTTNVFTLLNSIKTQTVCRTEDEALRTPLVEIGVMFCNNCDFYQINPVDFQHYDDEDYYLTAQLSNTQRIYQQWFIDYTEKYIVSPIAEIGPGDGYLGNLLTMAGHEYVGYEPARKSFEQCWEKGLHVVNEYFNFNDDLKSRFSTVIARQVLEHIDDVKTFLENVHGSLKEDGHAIFEVPNIERARNLNRIVDFCPEHLNYFSLSSLSSLLSSCNYRVVHLAMTYDEEYLLIVAGKMTQFVMKANTIDFSNLVFWGAGSRGISLCHLLRAHPLYFVDSDVSKFDKYIPSTPIKICPPAVLYKDTSCAGVVITSFFYFKEIMKELLRQGFSGRIYRINENNEIVPCTR